MELPGYLPLEVRLRYTHPLGALAPYFDGLRQGRAMATCSPETGRVWFPPRLICPDTHVEMEWCALSGFGQVQRLTTGPGTLPFATAAPAEICFALVAMEGADNCAIGRILENIPVRAGDQVQLVASDDAAAHPAQNLCFRRTA